MRLNSHVISSAIPRPTHGVNIATIRSAAVPTEGSARMPRAMKKFPKAFVKMTIAAKSGIFHFQRGCGLIPEGKPGSSGAISGAALSGEMTSGGAIFNGELSGELAPDSIELRNQARSPAWLRALAFLSATYCLRLERSARYSLASLVSRLRSLPSKIALRTIRQAALG